MTDTPDLVAQLERLARATEANTAAHQRSSEAIATMRSEFQTWKITRCGDHHARLEAHDQGLEDVRLQINGAIAKAAGAVGAATFIATILASKLVPLLGR